MALKPFCIYLNTIIALKIINLLLFAYLLTQLPSLFLKQRQLIIKNEVADVNKLYNYNQSHLKWRDVDILAPPDLENTILEAMRMNEWLAHPQYNQCAQKLLVGGIKDSFHLCADAKFRTKSSVFGKCLLISGRTESKGQFEQAVNNSRWAVFLPQPNPSLINGMQSDVEIHYMSELEEDRYFPVDKIVEGIRDETEEFSLAKLELYSPFLDATQLLKAPERLKQILQHLRARQLLVIVQVEPDTAAQVLLLWYRLFYDLFMHHNYALLGAESNLACGLDLQYFGHCEYRVNFIKTDLFEVDTAPVFGLGSPLEEKLRLLSHLQQRVPRCADWKVLRDQLPIPCLDTLEHRKCSKMVYIRYRLVTQDIAQEYGQFCNLTHLFYPEPTEIRLPSFIQLLANGVSPSATESLMVPGHTRETFWQLRPINELLRLVKVEPYLNNILSMDLDGGEWTVLENMTSQQMCPLLRSFQQILFRLRLWGIEEALNYRHFYLWFLRLEECGFEKVISVEISNEIHHVSYRRTEIV